MPCSNCKHWHLPAWETNGFGTCSQASAARDDGTTPAIMLVGGKFATLATRATFECSEWRGKDGRKRGDIPAGFEDCIDGFVGGAVEVVTRQSGLDSLGWEWRR